MTKSYLTLLTLTMLVLVALAAPAAGEDFSFSGFGAEDETQLAALEAFLSVTSAAPGRTYEAAAVIDIADRWHINSARPLEDWLIPAELEIDSVAGVIVGAPDFPAPHEVQLGEQTMSVYDGRVIVRFDVTLDASLAAGEYRLPVRLTYQACNDRECRPPQTVESNLALTVGSEGEAVHPELFAAATPVSGADDAEVKTGDESELERLIEKYGFWGYLLALGVAFVTGLLLSFSPCTYPMIPITVSIFAGQERSVGRGFVLSLFYVGSMAVVYGIMGLIVSLVGGVFGAWLANPIVVVAIAVVFVIFSLSMFGLYELQVPSSLRQKLGTRKTGGGVAGALVLGIIAALVISPCVGPFVAGILLYVATQGSPVFGFILLFVFALGLGTLFVIIGTFASSISRLPGAGGWMESVKKFFGFVLLLMALYFLRPIIHETASAVLFGFLLVAFGVFGGGLDRLTAEVTFFPRLKKFLGILALLLGIYVLAGTVLIHGVLLPPVSKWLPSVTNSENPESELIAWGTDLQAGLDRARAESKPVLIDTWATWCVNCRVLDRKTFGNTEVAAEAERFVPIKVQLETAASPITKDFMKRFNMRQYSLPTVLLIDSQGEVRRVLRGVVGPDEMMAEMRKVR